MEIPDMLITALFVVTCVWVFRIARKIQKES